MERGLALRTACALIYVFSQMSVCRCASESEWSYSGDNGPRYWRRHYPDCEGKYQSPVNIAKTREKRNMQPLRLKHYDKPLDDPVLVNDGHTLKLTVKESQATMSGGCLDSEYQFDHLHFHWGSENSQGSEHTVNDQSFAMEMHMVHINKKYDNLRQALEHGDGLAVLAVFYQVRSFNSSSLDPVVKGAAKIRFILTPVEIGEESFTLESLLPLEQNRFYCYRNGSLTTPGCSTVVTFTIFSSPVHIGQKQMDVFRFLRTGNSSASPFMADNFRPIQETNKRKLYFYNHCRTQRPTFSCLFLLILSMCRFALF